MGDGQINLHCRLKSSCGTSFTYRYQGILNQEELVSTFAKAMSRIADCLPRQQLSLILYPTTQMKQGVAQLYAFLLQFLIKALKWYQEGTVKHIIHSFTQPVGIKYKDILENIEECSRNIDMWAASSSQAELRDVHTLQQKMQTSVEKTRSVVQRSAVSVDEIMKVVIAMAPQLTTVVTGQLNTNQRVFDLQLSQMFTVTGKTGLLDPESSYRFGILRRNRLRQYPTRQSAFPQSPKLKNWAISQRSSLVIVRSTYSMRDQAKNFAVDVIEAVQSALIPISWILPNLVQDPSKPLSSTDILKSLVHQTMRLNQNFQQESTCALNCARMQSAVNETEWFDILGATLVGLPLIYIVFDASILNKTDGPLSEDFSWPVAFLKLFQELASRGSGTVVKLVIIQYNESRQMRVESLDQAQDSIVNVDRPARKTAKRQRVTLKNQLPFRRNEISTRQKREGDGYHNT